MTEKEHYPVPKSLQVQLARLFGNNSKEAQRTERTLSEWKTTLGKVLDELYSYLQENVQTDELHYLMLISGLYSAKEALTEDEFFFPGYLEGIMRVTFLLMGDYPDHRKRKGGRKKKNHYQLNRLRSLVFTQDSDQKLATLIAASNVGFPELNKDPMRALYEFRDIYGYKATYKDFLRWYKFEYPEDYATLF